MSDVHQIIPHRDVFKVFSTERIEEEVRLAVVLQEVCHGGNIYCFALLEIKAVALANFSNTS